MCQNMSVWITMNNNSIYFADIFSQLMLRNDTEQKTRIRF